MIAEDFHDNLNWFTVEHFNRKDFIFALIHENIVRRKESPRQ